MNTSLNPLSLFIVNRVEFETEIMNCLFKYSIEIRFKKKKHKHKLVGTFCVSLSWRDKLLVNLIYFIHLIGEGTIIMQLSHFDSKPRASIYIRYIFYCNINYLKINMFSFGIYG